ncbi:hypothetical protein Pure04_27840 [Paenarthrobacter ureafaciens]|nr:hypothetical protein Pure04_27840 [Paenarthrobacter ureafaciens]
MVAAAEVGSGAGLGEGLLKSEPGGRQAERPSIRTGAKASPMRWLRDRLFMTAPHLPDHQGAVM